MKAEKIKYLAHAEIINAGGEEILMVDFYDYNPIDLEKAQQPDYRLFMNKSEDFIYEPSTGKWFQRKVENLHYVIGLYNTVDYFTLLDKESERIINSFIPKQSWRDSWIERIQDKQEEFRREKSMRAYSARVDRIKRINKYIDSLAIPADFMKFVDNSFCEIRYTFYKAKGKKSTEAYCCHCNKTYDIDITRAEKPKHNEYGICPYCGSRIMYKSHGRVSELREKKEVILMRKTDDGFVSSYYDAVRTSGHSGETYKLTEKARVVYNGTRIWTYYNSNGYSDPKDISWWDRTGGFGNTRVTYGSGILYYANLDDVLKDTTFKYCAIKLLASHKHGYVIHHESFFLRFESARFIEYFIKMGLYNLANDYVRDSWSETINKNGKNVNEILGLSREQINRLIKMDGNLYTLELMQIENSLWKRFDDNQLEYIGSNNITLRNLNEVMKHTTVNRIIKYLESKHNIATPDKALQYWVDYIENCKILKYDLKNEFVLFPKRLKDAHDISAKEVIDVKNENREKLFVERMREAERKYSYETKTFAVIVPMSTEELKLEGQALHHCVGTYVDRVLEGKTIILFVRRKEKIEKPFYTMEVNKGEIIQCRGEYNHDMTEQVKKFVNSFKMNRLIKELLKEAI